VVGEDGKKREAEVDLSENARQESFFGGPKPFNARFLLRTEARAKIIKENWEQAQQDGYILRGLNVNVKGIVL
jgi:hypothetical protein